MNSSICRLFATGSVLAVATALTLPGAAFAQAGAAISPPTAESSRATVEEVVVTGSRVVANGNKAPTPLTVVSAETLQRNSPGGIARGVLELPLFVGSAPERGQNLGLQNASGAYLNLRQFGAQRNLILMDGIRIAPSTSDGQADINVVPQGLIQRVDIVTGGVSAVYGSDAVTGVVNFVLDHNFNGLKGFGQYGVSRYGDGDSWRGGLTGGMPVLGGRGHIEGTFELGNLDAVADDGHRGDLAGYPNIWTIGGNGTAAAPFVNVRDSRSYTTASPGGLIKTLGAMRDITFKENGVPTAFIHGATVPGSAGLEIGGDASFYDGMNISAKSKTKQGMGRFDYDLTDNIKFFVQAGYAQFKSDYNWQQMGMLNKTIFSGNPFIPASIQQYMTTNNLPSLVISKLPQTSQGYKPFRTDVFTYNKSLTTGFDGGFGEWKWEANYRFSKSLEKVTNENNLNQEKLAAALDAVRAPDGRIVCAVSLTATASRFPGCLPVNLFGPTAASMESIDYVQENTQYHLYNTLHDVNVSLSGPVFKLPAGAVVAALSGEFRHQGLENVSGFNPSAAPDCTGVRGNCTPTVWFSATTAAFKAKQDVYEGAVEVQAPLLANLPLIQSLEINLAGRYTNYSVSGSAYTWKVGGIWDVNDELRLRATRSRDIRAPTLFDLFAPPSVSNNTHTDLHTGVTAVALLYRGGANPNLTPEIGATLTAGFVYRPAWLANASLSLDYYDIKLTDAIFTTSPSDMATQAECENSGGTSPYCEGLVRPLPFSNRTAANFPSRIINQKVNVARQWTSGLDVEAAYRFDLASLMASAPGSVAVRVITNYQPHLRTRSIPSQPPTEIAGIAARTNSSTGSGKLKLNVNLAYTAGPFTASTAIRRQSKMYFTDPDLFVDSRAPIKPTTYVDIASSYKLDAFAHGLTLYGNVKNLFDKKPPINGQNPGFPGALYPVPYGFDVMGRYFTLGVRAEW